MLLFKRFMTLRNIAVLRFALLLFLGAALQPHGRAQSGSSILYTSGTYTQDFDGLPATTPSPDIGGGGIFAFGDPTIDASNMAGWYGEAAGSDSFFAGNGSSPNAGFYSFATSPSGSNNALGMISNSVSGSEIFGLL